MNDSPDKWQKLVAATRKEQPETSAAPPPKDFVHRVIGLKQSIIALSKVLFWRRWSRWVAVLCLLILIILFLILLATAPKTPLIEPPASPFTPATPR